MARDFAFIRQRIRLLHELQYFEVRPRANDLIIQIIHIVNAVSTNENAICVKGQIFESVSAGWVMTSVESFHDVFNFRCSKIFTTNEFVTKHIIPAHIIKFV